jgi:hypothetical protein
MLLFSVTLFSNGAHASGTLTISGTPASTIKAGSAYSFTPTVKDSLTGRTLAFNIVYKPSWASFSATTGKLSGTPTAANVGKFGNITIAVNDGINAATLSSFSITVQSSGGTTTPPPPTSGITISGTPASTATVGSAYSFTPTVKDSLTGRTFAFSIVYKPSWATFSATTGKLSGTPTAANVGKFGNITIAVNDGINAATLSSFSITVQAAGGTTSTVKISGTPATSVVAGSAYKFQPTATDSAGKTVSFSVQNKPAWATFSTVTGALTGIPTASQTGTYPSIVITASDGSTSAALAPFSLTVTPTNATTLAAKYPGDVGIGSDPAVVLYENFEEGSVSAVVARYDTSDNAAGMALVADHPANSSGGHAMQLTAGGSHPATDFYKSFGAGYDELYFRYYVKYHGSGPWHHSGLWIGGYNPALPYPDPKAGQRPVGNDRYSLGLEPSSDVSDSQMDFYTYWRGMHSWKSSPTGAPGDYYGNTLVHDAEFRVDSETWDCYEIHLKLNPDPTAGTGAILEVWRNDALVRRFDDSGPFGYWVKDKFCPSDADGTDCTAYRPTNSAQVLLDQEWRTTSALKINYFWPQNYNDAASTSSLALDDMVVAKQRIGCTVKK